MRTGTPVEIKRIGVEGLARYASVPISYEVSTRLRVTTLEGGLGGLALVEEPVVHPYVKDYDTDEPPTRWPNQYDVRNWGFFLATTGGRAVGGAAVAWDSPGLYIMEKRRDLASLYDIRVHPEYRGQGIGARLFIAAQEQARDQGCRQLVAETQDVNAPACRFYAAQGCTLGAILTHAYADPKISHEVMLLWFKEIH